MDLRDQQLSGGGHGFPRTRGDGPGSRSRCSRGGPFPPHARGWTPMTARAGVLQSVSPARAGMDPWRGSGCRLSTCFPRTRGDGPVCRGRPRAESSFPPHARGWTRLWRAAAAPQQVSPARAGMDRHGGIAGPSDDRFPRTRGDGPSSPPGHRRIRRFPPHARGWTVVEMGELIGCEVSPARAGMDPTCRTGSHGPSRFPRTRGDGPTPQENRRLSRAFPPHARGWTEGRTL